MFIIIEVNSLEYFTQAAPIGKVTAINPTSRVELYVTNRLLIIRI